MPALALNKNGGGGRRGIQRFGGAQNRARRNRRKDASTPGVKSQYHVTAGRADRHLTLARRHNRHIAEIRCLRGLTVHHVRNPQAKSAGRGGVKFYCVNLSVIFRQENEFIVGNILVDSALNIALHQTISGRADVAASRVVGVQIHRAMDGNQLAVQLATGLIERHVNRQSGRVHRAGNNSRDQLFNVIQTRHFAVHGFLDIQIGDSILRCKVGAWQRHGAVAGFKVKQILLFAALDNFLNRGGFTADNIVNIRPG